MIAQEKRIKMMFLRPKPGISTNTHKCHLSGRAFPKFCTSALYLFVWLTTSPFLIQIFIPLSPTHAHSLLYFFLSFSSPLFPLVPHSNSSFPFSFLFLLFLLPYRTQQSLPCSSMRFLLPFSFSSIFFLSSSLPRPHTHSEPM